MPENMQRRGDIEESDSHWSSPVVLVRKKNGDVRYCADNRKLNDITRRPFPTDPHWRHSGHARRSPIILHSGPEERLLADGSASGQQWEDCVLGGLRTIAIHGHALWPLQCSSDVGAINGDRLKRPHFRVISPVPGRSDFDLPDDPNAPTQPAEIVPADQGSPHIAQSGEVPTFSEGSTVPWAYCVPWAYDHRTGEAESRTGVADSKNKHEIRSFLGLCTYWRRFMSGFANIAEPVTKFTEPSKQ
jgi:hypothetical protein